MYGCDTLFNTPLYLSNTIHDRYMRLFEAKQVENIWWVGSREQYFGRLSPSGTTSAAMKFLVGALLSQGARNFKISAARDPCPGNFR